MATDTLVCIFLLAFGFALGYLFKQWRVSRVSSSGVIHVTETRDKVLYSLELTDYPEELRFKKVVRFDVDTSVESLDRE